MNRESQSQKDSPTPDLSVALFAGGRSRRMGADKATLLFGGTPWWRIQTDTLSSLGPLAKYVIAPQPPPWLPPGYTWIQDHRAYPDGGPLSGFAALAEANSSRHCLVLGIDLPLLRATTLQQLLPQAPTARGWIPEVDGRLQPFAACYTQKHLEQVIPLLEKNEKKVMTWVTYGLQSSLLTKIKVEPSTELEFLNGNTPEIFHQMVHLYETRSRK